MIDSDTDSNNNIISFIQTLEQLNGKILVCQILK